jgi:hypothetical protein
MPDIAIEHPVLILVVVFVVLFVTTWAGVLTAELLRPVKDEERQDLTLVIHGSLLLLTLVISFTYYFAMTKHDERKNCEIAEADAIATEHFRAGLLPSEAATPLREMILRYLDKRILFYTLLDDRQLEMNEMETQNLRAEMWQAANDSTKLESTSTVIPLVVDGMNGVLTSRRNTEASWKRRIPPAGWSLMILIAMYTCLLTGYGVHKKGILLYTLLPFLVAIAFFLMGDMDNPRHGIVYVSPDNLIDLSHFLHSHPL